MAKKRSKTPIVGDQILPLRVPEDMRVKVRDMATRTRLSDADIMRMAIDRGLVKLEEMFAEQPTIKAA